MQKVVFGASGRAAQPCAHGPRVSWHRAEPEFHRREQTHSADRDGHVPWPQRLVSPCHRRRPRRACVSRNSWTHTLGDSHAVQVDRSRAIPYSNHGVERETRLELATLSLARYVSHSVFGRVRNWPLNEYLPPISTGIHANHAEGHTDPTGVHADHNSPKSPERAVVSTLLSMGRPKVTASSTS
jgi:hypothetical protein